MDRRRPIHLMAKPIGPICNIRCEYCFYLSKEDMFPGQKNRSDFTMREDVLETFIRQYIEAQPEGIPEITFAWQGGEPTLLPQAFFEKAVELEHQYAPQGMKINNAFQTNGILVSKSRAQFFAENNFLIGISIDGPEELHNRYRVDRGGMGTFSDVMAGLENMKEAGVEFNTLTVVQEHNADHPERVYDFLKSIGSNFMQFIPIVERAPGVGGGAAGPAVGSLDPDAPDVLVSPRTVRPDQWGRFLNGVFDRWIRHDIGVVYMQYVDMLLGIYAGYPASLCTHGKTCGTAMAIEHDGTVYSCDHYVYPEYRLGNISDKPLIDIVNQPKQIKFGEDKGIALPSKCHECPFLKFCWGACPKDRIIPQAGEEHKLNWLCEGWFDFYAHTAPHLQAMKAALQARMPAREYRKFFRVSEKDRPGRNDPCPCGSGRKFKVCHGRLPSV